MIVAREREYTVNSCSKGIPTKKYLYLDVLLKICFFTYI